MLYRGCVLSGLKVGNSQKRLLPFIKLAAGPLS